MLLPAVGESSPFVPCQDCLDFTFINKLHLGSSLRSPSVDIHYIDLIAQILFKLN